MSRADIEAYVLVAARAQGIELDAERFGRVCAVFARNAEIARLVLELELPEAVEPAPVFRP